MEKKQEKSFKRSQQVVNFLRNPYNMVPSSYKNSMESLFPYQSPRIQQKTLTRKLFSYNSHRTTFPALNSSNNFYLKKNNKNYKKDRALYELNRYKQAIIFFDKAIEFELNDDLNQYNKGTLNVQPKYCNIYALTQYKEALNYYQKAIDIMPSRIYYTHQAIALENLGDIKSAYLKFKQALSMEQNYQLAIDRLKSLSIR